MKLPALLVAALALGACSADVATEKQSATTPMSAAEALDIAEAPAAPEATILAAKSTPEQADAVCNRGPLTESRSFIICEDGALRKAGVVAALSAPNRPDLTIEEVAAGYDIAPQVFTGIDSATYGTLVNGERQAPRRKGKHKAQTGLVQIQGKIYEVYLVSSGDKTGTIFVEQKPAEQ